MFSIGLQKASDFLLWIWSRQIWFNNWTQVINRYSVFWSSFSFWFVAGFTSAKISRNHQTNIVKGMIFGVTLMLSVCNFIMFDLILLHHHFLCFHQLLLNIVSLYESIHFCEPPPDALADDVRAWLLSAVVVVANSDIFSQYSFKMSRKRVQHFSGTVIAVLKLLLTWIWWKGIKEKRTETLK